MKVKFEVLGTPIAKGRPRFARQGNYVRSYTPEKTINYETLVRTSFQQQVGDMVIGDDKGIKVTIDALFPIPKSTSKKKTKMMLDGLILHTKKPDADNIAKSICDALNGVAFPDDNQITLLGVRKRYSDTPKVIVEIETYE